MGWIACPWHSNDLVFLWQQAVLPRLTRHSESNTKNTLSQARPHSSVSVCACICHHHTETNSRFPFLSFTHTQSRSVFNINEPSTIQKHRQGILNERPAHKHSRAVGRGCGSQEESMASHRSQLSWIYWWWLCYLASVQWAAGRRCSKYKNEITM